ncbi:MAG: hypothetical protein AAGK97_05645, partial [Bacteroidota bacterium]
MPLPKILCGPILRRTEKNKVSVWIAYSRNYGLKLKIYEGDSVKVKANSDSSAEIVSTAEGVNEVPLKADEVNAIVKNGQAVTAQFGRNLWVSVISAEPQTAFQTGKTYSYNINFRSADTPGDKGDFRTEGLLKDEDTDGRPNKALGYKKDILPSFILPADDADKLFIAHASCRKLHGHGNDALAYLD